MTKQRKPIIAGNWKMNKTATEARELVQKLVTLVASVDQRDIVIAPPFTALQAAAEVIKNTRIGLSAQNVFWRKRALLPAKYPQKCCWIGMQICYYWPQ